ncbi:regulatory iron-sulfur-containing complex subunit RicT [Gordonibacter sp. Marseille-P4307]|uniref:regulatory iron-sulfur-containing complex subunit RicT n=1 Tax=Gordonibacter sp. Marseille-P4307 TaxID=2161815 RepID=UPI000F547827|nr:regulatory iron-sulfur-containing complex subunit RicT [Gordonibacter sp. Marseille-P4307]
MVRVAPIRLAYNPKTLWFDARDLDLNPSDSVVVLTARGLEFGALCNPVFEPSQEQLGSLKSALKPVKRLATEEDVARSVEMDQRGRDALPLFKRLAAETVKGMRPIAVEFMFEGDKAVFYFESEERVDFRELVRKLAAEFHVRVDMKQIGVRDEARMVGGYGHCGQELCCRRLGGEFSSVSIRMAKEQDLSLNPQKISGVCGRLMCCLRYEYDAYKDFKGRAPKKNAKIETPDGVGKVVDLNVPREVVSVKLDGEKPVKVPLGSMCCCGDSSRPNCIKRREWERLGSEEAVSTFGLGDLSTSQITREDQLSDPTKVRTIGGRGPRGKSDGSASSRSDKGEAKTRTRRGRRASDEPAASEQTSHRQRRRRSVKLSADGPERTLEASETSRPSDQGASPDSAKEGAASKGRSSRRPRSRSGKQGSDASRSSSPQRPASSPEGAERGSARPGRRSSELRKRREDGAAPSDSRSGSRAGEAGQTEGQGRRRPRRRTHRTDASENPSAE